jgi:hypothetical protein
MQRLSILVSLVLTACVADSGGEAMQIRQNLAPAEGGCSFDPMASSAFLARGTITLDSKQPYLMAPLIESRITAVMGQESQRTVALRGARVDLELSTISVENGGQVQVLEFSDAENETLRASGATKFRSLFSAPLAPNGALTTGTFDGVSLPALAAIRSKVQGMSGAIHAQVLATVVVYGDLGGEEVESVPFVYPVTVCNDCIKMVLGTCKLPMGTTVRPGNACNLNQDGVVDCCLQEATGELQCPGEVATM